MSNLTYETPEFVVMYYENTFLDICSEGSVLFIPQKSIGPSGKTRLVSEYNAWIG